MTTETTLLREYEDEDMNNGEWPYPTQYKEFLVIGDLAEQVLNRLGRRGEVTIVEEIISTGYSEYTQETDYAFSLKVNGEVVFEPFVGYVGYGEPDVPETVFKQLNDWLDNE